ncbi:UDP-glycosyltransferase UGT5 [Condylostylus longicornis]|uniref:UDP-glycosyltransferase UGT5 n=1 Tax=Condylostylus longicornis TaxID=2530218 RepID=UPI00244E044A|nr:UDP-glycosyltransferase UGT5 [Condylostylus longicornis]
MKNEYIVKIFILIKLMTIAILPAIQSANILAILPSVWRSHYIFGSAILEKLSSNGHNITLITSLNNIELHPIKKNYFNKEIIVPHISQNWIDSGLSFNFENIKKLSILEYFTRMVYASTSNIDIILKNKEIKELITNSENKFDVIIGDIFLGDAYLGFTYRFQCPLVIISPTGNNRWIDEMIGNPITAARNPSNFLPLTEEMNFFERTQNTLMSIFEKFSYNFFHIMYQEKIYQKCFKDKEKKIPALKTLIDNIDLVLLNSNPVTQQPNAFLPHVKEVGGAHINHYQGKEIRLPNDVLNFIEESFNDVIYINIGGNSNTSELPEEKFKELLKLINELEKMNLRIILRWENFKTSIKSNNLYVKYWLPQQEILAHSKVKLFITTGGSMSIMEAVFYEKLIICIPILPQHEVNIKRIKSQGYGAIIENYEHLNAASILSKIKNLINNETYYENNKKISQKFKNVPNNPMNLSTYLIELLIKEKRFDYLKSSYYIQMNFIQKELIDVMLIILLGTIVIIGLPSIVICFLLRKNNMNSNNNTMYKKLSSASFDTSASTFLRKLMKSKNIDIKNKHKHKRN